jgi:prolyl-tRNA editing enzyme YbaK/EbsC (Cys-tRNA(Pro) deacylase)
MRPATHPSALRVQSILGPDFEVLEFDESTRTSEDAANAIGCAVAQIAKSLVFRAADGTPVLVVASGANRVDEKKVRDLLGQKIARADAEFAREMSGYPIGGVAPVGHVVPPKTLLDADLKQHVTLWAAAGTSNAVFRLTPDDLARLTGAAFADVRKA